MIFSHTYQTRITHLIVTAFFMLSLSFAFGQNKPGKEGKLKISKTSPTAKNSLPLPVIDIHMNANKANFAGPPPIPGCLHVDEWPVSATGKEWLETLMTDSSCKNKLLSEKTDEDVMNKTFAIMKRRNVYAVASGRLIEQWKQLSRIELSQACCIEVVVPIRHLILFEGCFNLESSRCLAK